MAIQLFGRADGKSNCKASPLFGDDTQKGHYNRNINCRSPVALISGVRRELMRFGWNFFDGGEEERKN
jgi:hypothetical protein